MKQKRVVSLEALIIDEIEHRDSEGRISAQHEEQIGGSGVYGARIFLPPSRLGMIVNHTDETLPKWMRTRLESYGPEMWYFKDRKDGKGTCRSLQTYQSGSRQETLIDYLLFNPLDLLDSPFGNPLPSTIHAVSFLERTARILEEIHQISAHLQTQSDGGWSPRFIWEPYYADTIPENWETFVKLVPSVDVFSPNHVEAFRLCSISPPNAESMIQSVERACKTLANLKPLTATIIRAGALGACYILTDEPGDRIHWVPAYWSEDQSQVVDPTGAGNGFMGGLAAALDEGLEVQQAIIWGAVAASFIVQQPGLPVLSDDGYQWNQDSVQDRIRKLEQKVEARV